MSLIIADGVRYVPWSTDDESQFEELVWRYYKDIFGEKSLFFDRKKLTSLAGMSTIPDGFIIAFSPPRWYIVEIELASHDPHKHIVPQISSFRAYHKTEHNRISLVDAFDNVIKRDNLLKATVENWLTGAEIYQSLREIMFEDPQVAIVINEKESKLVEATSPFQPRIVEFKIFRREGISPEIYAIQFEPIIKPEKEVLLPLEQITPTKPEESVPEALRYSKTLYQIIETIINQIDSQIFTAPEVYHEFKELFPKEFNQYEQKYLNTRRFNLKTLIAKNLKDYSRRKKAYYEATEEYVSPPKDWPMSQVRIFKKKSA